jgi:hypothetical protein
MSEETNVQDHNDGTWSGLKKTIVGVATTAVMGLGTWGVTKITGGGDEPAPAPVQQAAPIININNTQQQQQQAPAAGGTKTVIIKEKAAPATTPAPAPKKKEFTEEPKW